MPDELSQHPPADRVGATSRSVGLVCGHAFRTRAAFTRDLIASANVCCVASSSANSSLIRHQIGPGRYKARHGSFQTCVMPLPRRAARPPGMMDRPGSFRARRSMLEISRTKKTVLKICFSYWDCCPAKGAQWAGSTLPFLQKAACKIVNSGGKIRYTDFKVKRPVQRFSRCRPSVGSKQRRHACTFLPSRHHCSVCPLYPQGEIAAAKEKSGRQVVRQFPCWRAAS